MFNFLSKPKFMSRSEQIHSLRSAHPIAETSNPDCFDIGLQLVSYPNRPVLRVRIQLPPSFPEAQGPTMRIISRRCFHDLLNDQQDIIAPQLKSWHPSQDLALVVSSVLDEFKARPPLYSPEDTLTPSQSSSMPASHTTGLDNNSQGYQNHRTSYSSGSVDRLRGPQGSSGQNSNVISSSPAPNMPVSVPETFTAPSSFPSLSSLSLEALQEMLESSEKRAAFLNGLPEVSYQSQVIEKAVTDAEYLALNNVSLEMELKDTYNSISTMKESLKSIEGDIRALMDQPNAIPNKFSNQLILRDLNELSSELDAISTNFLKQALSSTGFNQLSENNSNLDVLTDIRDEYVNIRTRYHAINIKMELLESEPL